MMRPTPFDLVFADLAEAEFPGIQSGLVQGGIDPHDRDAFLLRGEAGAVIQRLRPEEGIGEGIAELAALTHHAYLHWVAGAMTLPIERTALARLLSEPPPTAPPGDPLVPDSFYLQLPVRTIWAELEPGQPHEPLDGCFVAAASGDEIRVLGVFGLHPDHLGFTVVEAAGPMPVSLARPDGAALFAPAMAGGAAAGLHSVTGLEELLELGWRARGAAREASTAADSAVRR